MAAYYHETLKQNPEALRYLESCGLTHSDMIDRIKTGFSNRTRGYRLPDKNRKSGAEIRGRLRVSAFLGEDLAIFRSGADGRRELCVRVFANDLFDVRRQRGMSGFQQLDGMAETDAARLDNPIDDGAVRVAGAETMPQILFRREN